MVSLQRTPKVYDSLVHTHRTAEHDLGRNGQASVARDMPCAFTRVQELQSTPVKLDATLTQPAMR